MDLQIAKWRDDVHSPVLLKIDDLANIEIKKSNSKELHIGEDWGHCAFDKNSMWDFLTTQLFNRFPNIKITFFLVTKQRASMTKTGKYSYNKAMDGDDKFIDFLRYLYKNPQVELSYHGTTHGVAGERVEDFVQEWEMFDSLDEAVDTIIKGKELFKSVLGSYPMGGKYCGYKEGKFGKESISKSGFKWWCFHEDNFIWDKNSTDSRYTYDVGFINGVVNIPTTVDASNLSLKIINRLFSRKYLKSLYLYFKEGKTVEKHIESLYNNRQIISVYEHTSPYMTNDTIQYPNIVTDIDNLNLIFSLLENKDVWYATCNEVADYFIDKSKVTLEVEENHFILIAKEKLNNVLTLTLPYNTKDYEVINSQGKKVAEFLRKENTLYCTYAFEINEPYTISEL